MAIFPQIKVPEQAIIGDKVRLDAGQSFVSKDEATITLVEIDPGTEDVHIDVTGADSSDWYLDWVFSGASRTETIESRVTTDGSPDSVTLGLVLLTAADAALFSTDPELENYESDILKYIPQQYGSFNHVHFAVQDMILDLLDQLGIVDSNSDKLTKSAIVDVSEVRQWAIFLALSLFYEGMSNAIDDIFATKSVKYKSMAMDASVKSRKVFRFDYDGDGTIEDGDLLHMRSMDILRR